MQLIVVVAGGAALIGAVILCYYAISYATLFLVSKLFPLTGRRRKPQA